LLSEIVDHILTMKRRKNFEIVDKNASIFFLSAIVLSIISMVLLLISLKRLDKKIIKARKEESKSEKKQLITWVKQNYTFNNSAQYKELSLLLENASQNYKWKFNMNSLIVLFIPIWSGFSINLIKKDLGQIQLILTIATVITVFGVYVGYWMKIVLEELFDTKYNKIIQAARFMAETSIELSVKENKKKRSRLSGKRI
jgi:Na+/melibiose symporter-like transporter